MIEHFLWRGFGAVLERTIEVVRDRVLFPIRKLFQRLEKIDPIFAVGQRSYFRNMHA